MEALSAAYLSWLGPSDANLVPRGTLISHDYTYGGPLAALAQHDHQSGRPQGGIEEGAERA